MILQFECHNHSSILAKHMKIPQQLLVPFLALSLCSSMAALCKLHNHHYAPMLRFCSAHLKPSRNSPLSTSLITSSPPRFLFRAHLPLLEANTRPTPPWLKYSPSVHSLQFVISTITILDTHIPITACNSLHHKTQNHSPLTWSQARISIPAVEPSAILLPRILVCTAAVLNNPLATSSSTGLASLCFTIQLSTALPIRAQLESHANSSCETWEN